MATSLAAIVRSFGITPTSIKLIARQANTHWRINSDAGRYVLRRSPLVGLGSSSLASVEWEVALLRRLRALRLPVAAPVAPPRVVDEAVFVLAPFLEGRAWRQSPGEASYRRLGRELAELHGTFAELGPVEQRPGWGPYETRGFLGRGRPSGAARLHTALRHHDRELERLVRHAIAEVTSRLSGNPPRAPMTLVHGDFSPWNLHRYHGRLSGVLDFANAHVDRQMIDVASARRGYHDAVVEGYLRVRQLEKSELDLLDVFWTAMVLETVWEVLSHETTWGPVHDQDLQWCKFQLEKTRPYGR